MIKLLTKLFIKNPDDVNDAAVRSQYGSLTGITGIVLNVLLCAGKLIVGILSGAVSVVADALNNLGDAGSSVITLIGFKMSAKPTDAEHPFGHGRIEYLTGLIVAIVIIVVGVELLKSSVEKIVAAAAVNISIVTIIILAVSIAVKLWMFFFNRTIGKKINSLAMQATALDSISDVTATTVVLICSLITYFTGTVIDGYAGIVVALFICITGFKAIKELISPLLGAKPDPEFVEAVADYVLNYSIVCGVHDVVVHNYGPGRQMISLHAEVPASMDILEAHDTIDNIEQGLKKKFNCPATIHMDPIITDDEEISAVKKQINEIVASVDSEITIHDFRMNKGSTHSNLIFDVVIPYDKIDVDVTVSAIKAKIKDLNPSYNAVINVDRPYV